MADGPGVSPGHGIGLFALPVSRDTLAAAKLVVYAGWLVVAVALTVAVLLLGFAFGLCGFDGAAGPLVVRQVLVTLLTGLLALPAAWAATVGRGLLPGIAAVVVVVVVARSRRSPASGAGSRSPRSACGRRTPAPPPSRTRTLRSSRSCCRSRPPSRC